MLYRDAVIGSGTPEKNVEWFLHLAKKLAISIKGKRLRSRSTNDVHRFLNQLERHDGIDKWQMEQARTNSEAVSLSA